MQSHNYLFLLVLHATCGMWHHCYLGGILWGCMLLAFFDEITMKQQVWGTAKLALNQKLLQQGRDHFVRNLYGLLWAGELTIFFCGVYRSHSYAVLFLHRSCYWNWNSSCIHLFLVYEIRGWENQYVECRDSIFQSLIFLVQKQRFHSTNDTFV